VAPATATPADPDALVKLGSADDGAGLMEPAPLLDAVVGAATGALVGTGTEVGAPLVPVALWPALAPLVALPDPAEDEPTLVGLAPPEPAVPPGEAPLVAEVGLTIGMSRGAAAGVAPGVPPAVEVVAPPAALPPPTPLSQS
jgi:hypothetical protein